MVPLFSDPSILSYFQGKHSALELVLPRLKKKKKGPKNLSTQCLSVNHVRTRTQGWINSIPDLVVIYCLHLGHVKDYTPLWSLRGVYVCIFLRSGGCGHLL